MGAVILKHLQNLPCNAHEISEIEYSNCNLRESTVHELAQLATASSAYAITPVTPTSSDTTTAKTPLSAPFDSSRKVKKSWTTTATTTLSCPRPSEQGSSTTNTTFTANAASAVIPGLSTQAFPPHPTSAHLNLEPKYQSHRKTLGSSWTIF
ncbi:Uncharacterized protein FKW44_013402 [Caligus rogercresseyi]|uniref:Uncharacterized protein n=1 Tax=Caligus rogercresseyi TaxID=217165 RepID=A0A7T8HL35_CALRO|nr:Uncharacterized protein FKW44_013402 [Caligus rogercresseyi]